MRRKDRDDPFGEFFEEFERMMNEMFGGAGSFHFETMAESGGDTHIDIYEEEEHLRVVADLPGVEKSDIDVTCDGRIVRIRAEGERRSYDERVRLPQRVDEESATATYNNGVLEVRFDLLEGGQSINIS